jgi:hypothetical protein
VTDAPTIEERYARATVSSDLKVRETHCDTDILMAAAWVHNPIGMNLLRLRSEFDRVKAEVGPQGNAETQMLLVLLQLRGSLSTARNTLGTWGVARAQSRGYGWESGVTAKLVGRVLDVWLRPLCGPCDGRGYTGGGRHEHSGPRIRCAACGETGKRRQRVGKSDEERQFVDDMLHAMEMLAQDAASEMARNRRGA